MKRIVVALHGNPGEAGDLAPLAERITDAMPIVHFHADTQPLALNRLIKQLEQQVQNQRADEVIVLAFSWGAYLALHWLRNTQQPVRHIVLVNPTLVAGNPISALTDFLTGLPGLGSAMLMATAVRTAGAIIDRMFAPELPPQPYRDAMVRAMNSPSVWRKAIERKRMQQRYPLAFQAFPAPHRLLIVRGESDQMVNWAPQQQLLAALGVDSAQIHSLPGAGHGLPWTRPDAVASLVKQALGLSYARD